MNTLYLDLFSGISGDMFLGAMLDLGVDAARLEAELRRLGVEGWHLHVGREKRGGFEGVRCTVHLEGDHHHEHYHEPDSDHHHGHSHHHHHTPPQPGRPHGEHRTFTDIRALLEHSALPDWVRAKAIAVFQRLAVAEGKVHGRPPEEVHFHEVGAVDSIVDIVGACLALDLLGRPQVVASSVTEGTGSVHCAHVRLPLPAPATLELFAARGVAVHQCDEPHELVTPTGAALLAEFAESFGPMPPMTCRRLGYGLGQRENTTRPNILRALLGETSTVAAHDWESDRVAVLETNLDDVSSEILGGFVEKALSAGALDVFHTAIQMKKSRPGVLLTVLCQETEADRFSEMLLRETSAFGVRRTLAERRKLRRETVTVATPLGPVEVKLGRLDGQVLQAAPEFESCRHLAAAQGVPLRHVYEAALKAWADQGK
jgi:pyridinium-3,5-bisthiocarboxylic acid mononucleotide nickel chelatase